MTTLRPSVRFDDFELRSEEAALFRRGRKLKLQPQPFRVLAYLVARAPSIVSREELGEHIWGDGVHVDLDQSLYYCVRQIRQVLEDDAAMPRYVETLPRQGYRFIGPAELAPAPPPAALDPGMQSDEPSVLPAPVLYGDASVERVLLVSWVNRLACLLPKWKWRTIAALATVGVLILAGWSVVARKPLFFSRFAAPRLKSVAVLPLENLSGDPQQEYLADGMTDELTTMLARDSTLRIVSRTSASQYKGTRRPLPEVARALGVDSVIEGSLARSGTRLHMTLQLIRADTDSHMWADSYDGDANDPTLANQAAISIAKRLNSTLKSAEPARYIAPEAHDAYLRGRYLWPTERMKESGQYFRRATEIQPDYAEAWAGLADFYGEGIAGGALDPRTYMHLEEEAAERAMTIAPNLSLSHRAIAGVYLIDRWDATTADREVLMAINLDPSDAVALYFRANVLEALNRFPEAIQVEKKSMEMDPYGRRDGLASIYLGARAYDEALAELELRMEAAPNDAELLELAALVWRSKGNYKEAMKSLARSYVVGGDTQAAAEVRRAYELRGAPGFVRWQLDRRLKQAKKEYVSPVELASYFAQIGDKKHTLTFLEEGFRQRSTDLLWVPDDPAYDFLHGDSRYEATVRKLAGPAR